MQIIHSYYVTSTVLRSLRSFIIHNFLRVKLMRYLLPFLPLYGKKRKLISLWIKEDNIVNTDSIVNIDSILKAVVFPLLCMVVSSRL